jgi:hypothetical protein
VAPSSSLSYSGDPGATVAHACLHSGDFTAMERSGTARSRLFPQSDSLRLIHIKRPEPRIPLHAPAPDTLARLSAPPVAAHPSQSNFSPSDLDRMVRTPQTPSDPSPSDRDQTARTPIAIYFPSGTRPRSVSALSPPLSLTLPIPPVSARPPARALGRRSNLDRRFLIQRLDSPDTPSRGCFA